MTLRYWTGWEGWAIASIVFGIFIIGPLVFFLFYTASKNVKERNERLAVIDLQKTCSSQANL